MGHPSAFPKWTLSTWTSVNPWSETRTSSEVASGASRRAISQCDQLFFHATMAMFNPSLADELLLYDCPFPYDPAAISMEGGAEDPSIAAPYEPRPYQELFDVMTAERIGFCSFGRVAEPAVRGFVYGFTVAAKPETCAGNDPTIEVVVREYASRAHRGEAANTLAAPVVQAYGRFTITVDGSDAAAVDRLAAAFVALGVHQVAG